ncbi:MAG TPA: hypothetical protein DHW40_12405 [Microbacterium sp.]|nr:hypothetical protein [Microbacterium sp.]
MSATPPERHAVTVQVDAGGTASILGAELFTGGIDDLLTTISALARSDRAHLVITPNVDQVLTLEDDPHARETFRAATLRIADGAPVVALARLLGARGIHRITGTDLLRVASARADALGWRIAVVGGSEDALLALEPHDGVTVFRLPIIRDAREDDASLPAVRALHDFAPHLVFVCLGSPKQEFWFERWQDQLPPGVYVGAGAAVDFLAGVFRRAPRTLQVLGLEWAWRLAQEPRRLAHRYLVKGPRFVGVAARSLRAGRIASPGASHRVRT